MHYRQHHRSSWSLLLREGGRQGRRPREVLQQLTADLSSCDAFSIETLEDAEPLGRRLSPWSSATCAVVRGAADRMPSEEQVHRGLAISRAKAEVVC